MATPTKKDLESKPAPKKASTKKPPTKTATKAIDQAEKKVDAFVSHATAKAKRKISPNLRQRATEIAGEAEFIAKKVESVGQELEQVTDGILPSSTGSKASFHAERSAPVSRLFIFRCLRLIIQGPIICIWSIRYCIISIVHYIMMFIMGERDKHLRNKQARYRRHVVAWKSYMNAITDKRPNILED